jgi:tetratricopeptide (TPR) repeat protein
MSLRLPAPRGILIMPGVTGVLLALLAQAAASSPPASNPDFPRYDRAAWDLQRVGLTAKAAERSLRTAPDAVDTLERLLAAERTTDALRVLQRIVDRHPERMAKAFETMSRAPGGSLSDDGMDHKVALQRIVEAAFGRLAALPREEAAAAERQLMMVDTRHVAGRSFNDNLAQFVDKYRGTEAATLADLEMRSYRRRKETLDGLDAFIREHPGGLLAARALHRKGQYLSSNPEVGETDPTDRFMTVLDIARELQSGRYTASEWVDRAPRLVTGFFWSKPSFPPLSLNVVLDVFFASLKAQAGTFAPYDYAGPEDIVTRRLPDLFERSGEGVAGVERMLDRFDQETGDRAMADYLRAVLSLSRLTSRGYFYRGNTLEITDGERSAQTERATRLLDALSRGDSRYARWALATLAAFYFEQLDFIQARVRYQEYLDRFGTSEYAWLAALRLGECAEGSGDPAGAIDAYRAAASRRGAGAVAVVMGRVGAARIFESQARLDLALAEYRRALASWDSDYGREYSLQLDFGPRSRAHLLDQQLNAAQLELKQRVQRLSAAVASPPKALLERGRWLLEQRRWTDARAEFDRLLSRHPRSAQVEEARHGAHVADLRQALDLVKSSGPGTDAAVRLLRGVAADRYDHVVTLAKIAHASATWLQGATADADALMTAALNEWRNEQRARPGAAAQTPLEIDVVAIRGLIFRPRAGRAYLIVNSDVKVTLSDGEHAIVSNAQPLPGFQNVVFFNSRDVELLQAIAAAFRTETDSPREPMTRLLGWWQNYFEAGPMTWGHVAVETHPFMWRLLFTDRARTTATARVSTGASTGHSVALRKVRGVWQIVRTGGEWMS